MASFSLHVMSKLRRSCEIPQSLSKRAMVLAGLAASGALDRIGERLHIRRQGGFCGLDIYCLLAVLFADGASTGIRTFWETHWQHMKEIAALAGRKWLASPAAVSRALSAVENELLRPVAGELLTGPCDVLAVMRHPAALHRDRLGAGVHVFDIDPTVTTLRHRALPEDDDLPEPRRRSEDTGKPGTSGRKRGDLPFRRMTVQHAGAGIWLGAQLSKGSGDGLEELKAALEVVGVWCQRLGIALYQAVVRLDGESLGGSRRGGVDSVRAGFEAARKSLRRTQLGTGWTPLPRWASADRSR